MHINYLSAPAGAGKTHALVDEIHRLTQEGDRVILCQPTIRLIDETVSQLKQRFPTVHQEVIHGHGSVGKIMSYLKSPFPEPHVLIITWEAFQRLKFVQNRMTWHLLIDEIPQAYACFDENLPKTHHLITKHLKAIASTGESYSLLVTTNRQEVRRIAENKGEDRALHIFQPLAVRLESLHWLNYVPTGPYERLCTESTEAQKLTVFSFLKPSMFERFKSVLIAGASFKDSVLYHSFSQQGVEFHEARTARDALRFTEHSNGAAVTFCYAIESHWSKKLRNSQEGALREKLVKGVKELFEGKEFVWSANKDVPDDLFGPEAVAKRLPQSPHGLNSFSDFDNVAFLSAHNLIPAHAKFVQAHLNVSQTDLQTALHRQQAYQAIMRGSLRDPLNSNSKTVFVPDLPTAKWLHEQFPGSTLRFLDFGLGIKSSNRGRKRIHKSNAERKKHALSVLRKGLRLSTVHYS